MVLDLQANTVPMGLSGMSTSVKHILRYILLSSLYFKVQFMIYTARICMGNKHSISFRSLRLVHNDQLFHNKIYSVSVFRQTVVTVTETKLSQLNSFFFVITQS